MMSNFLLEEISAVRSFYRCPFRSISASLSMKARVDPAECDRT